MENSVFLILRFSACFSKRTAITSRTFTCITGYWKC